MWESGEWGQKMWRKEIKAEIPSDILACAAVSREINFSSAELMEEFKLQQRIFYQGMCIEEWYFDFGFVIPGSTNSWQEIIEAADESDMLPAEELSGNITIVSRLGQFKNLQEARRRKKKRNEASITTTTNSTLQTSLFGIRRKQVSLTAIYSSLKAWCACSTYNQISHGGGLQGQKVKK